MRLIDADAITSVNFTGICYISPDDYQGMARFFKSVLEDAPTIEAAPVVHGRWIIHTDNFTPYRQCTECGFEMPVISTETKKENNMKYCNNCGAKMGGEA